MLHIISIGFLERSILVVSYIVIALLIRKYINKSSPKYSMMILWGIILSRLIIPYTVLLKIPKQVNDIGEIFFLPLIFTGKLTTYISENMSSLLPEVNRVIVTIVVISYVAFQIFKTYQVFKNSKEIEIDKKLYKYLMKTVPIKRKVRIFINNNLKTPVTYGVIHPKIIIQNRILKDEVELKYVLVHEMTHIKKFDVIWNHLKNILVCTYWYNPFVWLMSRCITEDLEVLCDKLVIERTKSKEDNKLEYMYVMFQVLTQGREKENTKDIAMKLNPTVERMVILKTMKIRKIGIATLATVLIVSATAFAHVEENEMPVTKVIETTASDTGEYVINTDNEFIEEEINQDDRTTEIIGEEPEDEKKSVIADINESCSLPAFTSNSHNFTMYNFYGGVHKNFTTKISNVSSRGRIDYKVVIEESGYVIFSKSFNKAVSLRTSDAKNNRDYRVTIVNNSNKSLKYDIAIKSYR